MTDPAHPATKGVAIPRTAARVVAIAVSAAASFFVVLVSVMIGDGDDDGDDDARSAKTNDIGRTTPQHAS